MREEEREEHWEKNFLKNDIVLLIGGNLRET